MTTTPDRVWVLIDGFNFYYALRDAIDRGVAGTAAKWLDYSKLARGVVAAENASSSIVSVKWYTSYVLDNAQAVNRHSWYRRALEAQGVETVEGHYKQKSIRCRASCRQKFITWEEKATDVNLAIDIVTGAAENSYDTLFLFSGDSDIAPAVARARKNWAKKIVVVVPGWRLDLKTGRPHRHSEFQQNADKLVRLDVGRVSNSQLPDVVPLANGKAARRPPEWT